MTFRPSIGCWLSLHRQKPGHLAEVLGGSGEEELVFCSIWSPQAQPIQLQYALEMRKQHLNRLSFPTVSNICVGQPQIAGQIASAFMD